MTNPDGGKQFKIGDKAFFMCVGSPAEGIIEEVREVKLTVYGIRSVGGTIYSEVRKEDLYDSVSEIYQAWK